MSKYGIDSGGAPPLYGTGGGAGPSSSAMNFPIQFHVSSPYPCVVKCPHCSRQVTTDINHKVGSQTHLMAFLFVVCLVTLPVFFVPYMTKSFKDVVHSCPNCKQYIGTYERSTHRR